MRRMNFTWLGLPGPTTTTGSTYHIVLVLVSSYVIFVTSLDLYEYFFETNEKETVGSATVPILKSVAAFLFLVWSIYALYRTREGVRKKYSIKEERCIGHEDLCCSIFCSCCAVAQIARHTGEFEIYPSVCCSETGLSPDAPLVI